MVSGSASQRSPEAVSSPARCWSLVPKVRPRRTRATKSPARTCSLASSQSEAKAKAALDGQDRDARLGGDILQGCAPGQKPGEGFRLIERGQGLALDVLDGGEPERVVIGQSCRTSTGMGASFGQSRGREALAPGSGRAPEMISNFLPFLRTTRFCRSPFDKNRGGEARQGGFLHRFARIGRGLHELGKGHGLNGHGLSLGCLGVHGQAAVPAETGGRVRRGCAEGLASAA